MSEEKKNGSKDAAELAEILDVVSARLPALFGTLRDTLYSVEVARQMGQAVGTFYKELVTAGMTPEEAQHLTREYMSTIRSFSSVNLGNTAGDKQKKAE